MSSSKHPGILFFIETGGPGGAERVVLNLATAFRDRGHRVSTATLREGWLTENLTRAGIDHTLIRSERHRDVTLPFRLSRLAREKGADLLHTHLLDSNLYGAIASKVGGLPHLATEHGDVHHIARKRFSATKLRILGLLGSRFTAVSEYSAERLIELGIHPDHVTALPNPIPSTPAANPEGRRSNRAALGVTDEWDRHWIWIHVANIRPVKDQETLLRAFALSRKAVSNPRQTLAIVGDGDERQSLEMLAADLRLGDSIRFLGFREDVPQWLAAADGFVLSSRSEAMPMSLLEGMAAGLFPVSTDVGGVREVVGEGEGRLVTAGDSAALGDALAKTVGGAAASRESAAKSALRIQRDYSVETISARYIEIYNELLRR